MPSIPKISADRSDSSAPREIPATTDAPAVAEERAQRAFLLSAIAHAEFDALAALGPELEQRLNDRINLADYSETIKQVQIVPLLLAHDSPLHAAEVRFDVTSGELLLSPRLGPDVLAGVEVGGYPAVLADALALQTLTWDGVPRALVERIGVVIADRREEVDVKKSGQGE